MAKKFAVAMHAPFKQLTHQIWLDLSNGLGDSVMGGQTESAICNIPIAFFFLKKCGDNYIFMLYHTNNHKQNVLVNALQKFHYSVNCLQKPCW